MFNNAVNDSAVLRGNVRFLHEPIAYSPRNVHPVAQLFMLACRLNDIAMMDVSGMKINPFLLETIERDRIALPSGADGWFVLPRWQRIADSYQAAVAKVLNALGDVSGNQFSISGNLGFDLTVELRETPKKALAMEQLYRDQNADILLLPAQFGMHHVDQPSYRAVRFALKGVEFCLGAYEIGIMLLLAQEAYPRQPNGLKLDCAGDEIWVADSIAQRLPQQGFEFRNGGFTPDAIEDTIEDAPSFMIHESRKIQFSNHFDENVSWLSITPTAFIPFIRDI